MVGLNSEGIRARKKLLFGIGTIAIAILVVWGIRPIRGYAGILLAQVGEPLWQAREAVVSRSSNLSLSLLSKKELISRAQKLAELEDRISVFEKELKQLREENERLRRVSADEPLALALRVLSRPGQSPFDTMFIVGGKNQGIKKGDLIFADDLVAIGTVDEVYSKSSRVLMYSSSGLSHSAFLSSAQTAVLLEGEGGQNFTIQLPQAIGVAVGDTASLPLAVPNIVAQVVQLSPNANEPIKTLYLRSPVNIFSLEWIKLVPISK